MKMAAQKWINQYLSKDDVVSVSSAVAAAESNSGGEIVPMIIKSCTGFSHVGVISTTSFFLLYLLIYFHYEYALPSLHWSAVIGFGALISFAMGFALASSSRVRRILTSQIEMEMRVQQRAELEFYRHKVNSTKEGTGVLIMISVAERKLIIFPDPVLADRIPRDLWDLQVREMIPYLKRGEWAAGLNKVIQNVGNILAQHVPRTQKDKDELPNHLIITE